MENKISMQLAFFYEHQNIISNINIFKLSVYANISENDSKLIIFEKPGDWCTTLKILSDLELFLASE